MQTEIENVMVFSVQMFNINQSLDTDDIHQSDFKKILKLFYFRDVLEVDKVQIILQRKVYS